MWVCSIYRPLTLWQVFSISSRNHKSPPRSAENGDVSSIRLNLSSIRVHFFKAPTLVNTMRGDGAGSSTSSSSRSVIDTPAQQRTPLFIHLAFSLEMIRRVKPDFFRIFLFWYFDVLCEDQLVSKKFLSFQIHIAYLNLTFQDFLCWYFDVLCKDQLIPNNIFSFQIHIAYFLIWWKLPNNPGVQL